MGTFGERLKASLLIAGVSESLLATRSRVEESEVLEALAMDEADISAKTLAHWGLILGVSLRWLALGVGTPVPVGMAAARKAKA